MKGTYIVVLSVSNQTKVEVGSIGSVDLPEGEYGYVGSAMGSGGLESRINRHRKTAAGETENLFWHIDYILDHCSVSIDCIYYSRTVEECDLGELLEQCECEPFGRIGSSDCSCQSHMFKGDVETCCEHSALEQFHAQENE